MDVFKIENKFHTEWRLSNGKLHQDNDLPAVVYQNGDKFWYQYGALHRVSGPAFVGSNGYKEYYLNGDKYSLEHFEEISCNLQMLSRYKNI